MSAAPYRGYADPGFRKELAKLARTEQEGILQALRALADDPLRHPDVKSVSGSPWPGSVRVRCGPFRVLALVLPKPKLVLFTTVFRKKRASDYAAALRKHDRRVREQGPPLDEFLR